MGTLIKTITINKHDNIIVSLAFSGMKIIIWTVKKGKILKKFCDLIRVYRSAISLDSRIMAIGGSQVILFCIKNWKNIRASLTNYIIECILFYNNERSIITAGSRGKIQILHLFSG